MLLLSIVLLYYYIIIFFYIRIRRAALRAGHLDELGGLERSTVQVRCLSRRSDACHLRVIHRSNAQEQERDHQTGDDHHGQEHGQTGDERRHANAHVVA